MKRISNCINVYLKKIEINYKKLIENKWMFFSLRIVLSFGILRLFMSTVSLDGEHILSTMTSDHWNMGKSLLNGKILYKDISDNKGLYLFLMYSFLVWISKNSIAIVPFVESILYIVTVGLFFFYLKNNTEYEYEKKMYLQTILFAIVYFVASLGSTLLNTEGVMVLGLFSVWNYVKNLKTVQKKPFFFIGIFLGVLFNFKITSVVLFFPLFLNACYEHFKNKGKMVDLIKCISCGIAGFVFINIPFVFYLIKNECYFDFLKYYKFATSGKCFSLVEFFIALLCLTIALFLKKKNEDDGNTLLCLSTFLLYFSVGEKFSYYMAAYVCVLMMGLFPKKGNKLFHILGLGIVFAICSLNIVSYTKLCKDNQQICQKEVAMQYEIDNSNILYIFEDIGYGCYKDASFVENYQWIPDRYYYSDEFMEEYVPLTIERLETKQFRYVYIFSPEKYQIVNKFGKTMEEIESNGTSIEKLNLNKIKIAFLIQDILFENYKPISQDSDLYVLKD